MIKKMYSRMFFVLFFVTAVLTQVWAQKKTHRNVGTQTIKLIQVNLQKAGFEPGKIDGMLGWRTKRAIKRFQRKHKIRVTGRLNRKTMEALFAEDKKPVERKDIKSLSNEKKSAKN